MSTTPPPPPPGGQPPVPPPPPLSGAVSTAGAPPTNMGIAVAGAILGFFCGFCIGLIIGIIAIVFASQVNSKYQAGDVVGAKQASDRAKLLGMIAIIIAAVGLVLNIILVSTGNFYVNY